MRVEILSEDISVVDRWMAILREYAPESVEEITEESDTKLVLADFGTNAKDILQYLKNGEAGNVLLVVLEGAPSVERGKSLLISGARGYGNAFMQPLHLKSCVDSVINGFIWVYPELVNDMISSLADRRKEKKEPQLPETLTQREREIVYGLLDGRSNKEISKLLDITERTVKAHLGNIYRKVGVSNRLELVTRLGKEQG